MEERWIGVMTEYPKTRNAVFMKKMSEKMELQYNKKIKRSISNIVGVQRVREA